VESDQGFPGKKRECPIKEVAKNMDLAVGGHTHLPHMVAHECMWLEKKYYHFTY
jgi:hypothetical protein